PYPERRRAKWEGAARNKVRRTCSCGSAGFRGELLRDAFDMIVDPARHLLLFSQALLEERNHALFTKLLGQFDQATVGRDLEMLEGISAQSFLDRFVG